MYNNRYLAHYGIKGVKWGVRRYQNADGSLTEAGQKREQKRAKKYGKKLANNWIEIHNRATDINNAKLGELNKKYEKIRFS